MKKDVKLYSAFFPFYGILLLNFKNLWWMVLANTAILTLICFLVLMLRRERWKALLPGVAGRAVAASLFADGAALLARFLPTLAEITLRLFGAEKAAGYLAKYWSDFTWYEIWAWWNPVGLPWTVGSILVGGFAAFALNYWVLLKKILPDKKTRLILSVLLGVFSAPYSWTNPAW